MEHSRPIAAAPTCNEALIIAYHDIGPGRSPLCVPVELLRAHLDGIARRGATPMTVLALGEAMRENRLPHRPVCLTFDDGFASVVDDAAPILLERGVPATIFAVAGYLGRTNDWPSQPDWVERRPLATATQLAELAGAGFEIGAHGVDHEPLALVTPHVAHRELVDGKAMLEDAVGVPVESYAYPYGSLPASGARAVVERTYASACTTKPRLVRAGDDLIALPRVDAHYLRGTELLTSLLQGGGGVYLFVRRAGRRLRRLGRSDWRAA